MCYTIIRSYIVTSRSHSLSNFNSANPNQAIVIWGSGVGADSTNDDKVYPHKQNNLTGIPMQVFVGGVSAPIAYTVPAQTTLNVSAAVHGDRVNGNNNWYADGFGHFFWAGGTDQPNP